MLHYANGEVLCLSHSSNDLGLILASGTVFMEFVHSSCERVGLL